MCFLCANLGQGYIAYSYIGGKWDKKISQFNKKPYWKKNAYEWVRPQHNVFFITCQKMWIYDCKCIGE